MDKMSPKKKRPPKRLEKMLLINHKEDQQLEDRLSSIHLKSRLREMELDRERINVRNEFRASKKKQIPIEQATRESTMVSDFSLSKRPFSSVPDNLDKFELPDREQLGSASISRPKHDSVSAYVINEHRKMSEVIPSILASLSRQEEKNKVKEQQQRSKQPPTSQEQTDEYVEPDMNRIRKVVRSIKTLRHNMAVNKRMENYRPSFSVAQIFKDINEKNDYEMDQFTDGACVLIKRKMEKHRKQSVPGMDPNQLVQRRHSSYEISSATSRKGSAVPSEMRDLKPDASKSGKRNSVSSFPRSRSTGALTLPPLSRSTTTLTSVGMRRSESAEFKNQYVDEDELIARKRLAIELQKYQQIKQKIDQFLVVSKPKFDESELLLSLSS